MSKATPGPWRVYNYGTGVVAVETAHDDHGSSGNICNLECFDTIDETLANARLIAAAPDYKAFTELFLNIFAAPGVNAFLRARREVSAEEMNLLVKLATEATAKTEGRE